MSLQKLAVPHPVTTHIYPALTQTGRIGSLELPHRILMGSMHLGLEGDSGLLQRLIAFYVERAEGQAGLIITGGVAVLPQGGGDHMYTLTNPADRTALAAIPAAVHAAGGHIAMQLFHAGRYAFERETGLPADAPSALPSKWTRSTPREMSTKVIQETIDAFASGALHAKEMGYDAIEVMGSEGYLLNEFLSPLTNHREDEYGGDLAGRMRISLDVVKAIRQATGDDYPVIFRMSGEDCMPGSTTREETLVYAQALDEAGVDALNIGIGWHESQVPTVAAVVPRGAFAPVAAEIRQRVQVPVIGANRINTPELAEDLIARGWLDFVAPARPWLADGAFAAKALRGERQRLNVCIACNQSCLDNTLAQPPQPASCLVNPRAGSEIDRPMVRAGTSKRVAVVGGGPAGLEAARTAAVRGHQVTLFEARAQLGGQLQYAARVPGKEEFYETLRYYEVAFEDFGVDVRLGHAPTAAELTAFDEVILAQGVQPAIPEIPGVDLPHVVTYADVLSGKVGFGRQIVILGAGGIGCDTAKFLLDESEPAAQVTKFLTQHAVPSVERLPRQIAVVARSHRIASTVGRTTRWIVRSELKRPGVEVVTHFAAEAITAEGVIGVQTIQEKRGGRAGAEARPAERVGGSDAGQQAPGNAGAGVAQAVGQAGQAEQGQVEQVGQEPTPGTQVRRVLAADQVILCVGQTSRNDLAAALEGQVSVHVIGGARDSAKLNAARAIREGFETAYAL